jgi:hypothetical protein
VQLGLIEGYTAEDHAKEEEEEWEEFDEDELNTSREDTDSSLEDEDEYVIDERRRSSVEPTRTMSSPEKDRNNFMAEDREMPVMQIDFSSADPTVRRKKRDKGKFTSIAEENGDDEEDEESTVDGEDDNHTVEALESENYEPVSSTTMSPALKKFSL